MYDDSRRCGLPARRWPRVLLWHDNFGLPIANLHLSPTRTSSKWKLGLPSCCGWIISSVFVTEFVICELFATMHLYQAAPQSGIVENSVTVLVDGRQCKRLRPMILTNAAVPLWGTAVRSSGSQKTAGTGRSCCMLGPIGPAAGHNVSMLGPAGPAGTMWS